MTREQQVQEQLRAVQFLRALKRGRTYNDLAQLLEISPIVLNRYVKGHVLPGPDRAAKILELCSWKRLSEQAQSLLRFDEDNFVDNTGLLFNTAFLGATAGLVATEFSQAKKILTAAVDGIPLATHVAAVLKVDCLFAKRGREIGVPSFVESRYKLPTGQILNYFLPDSALSSNERVLIVDDLMRSGETQAALVKIAQAKKATIIGVFSLIQIGNRGYRRLQDLVTCPIKALVQSG